MDGLWEARRQRSQPSGGQRRGQRVVEVAHGWRRVAENRIGWVPSRNWMG